MIQTGTPLYLQDVHSNLLHGLFEAIAPAGMLLEPQAFAKAGQSESMYPVQVKFQIVLEAPRLEDGDPEVCKFDLVIKKFEVYCPATYNFSWKTVWSENRTNRSCYNQKIV
jgi:hypothetical protein